jgi:tRNA threonylcarbamoyladenosine biosynthesis protein TsaB
MGLTLVLHTALRISGGVSLFRDDELLRHEEWGDTRQTGTLLPVIMESLLRENGLKPANIDQVIFASGPGSFTGLRVGLSFLKGLFFQDKTVYLPVSTLECLARNLETVDGDIFPLVFYRKGEAFTAHFYSQDGVFRQLGAPYIINYRALQNLPKGAWLTGEPDSLLPEAQVLLQTHQHLRLAPPHLRSLSPRVMFTLGSEIYKRHGAVDLATAEPAYHAAFKPRKPESIK